MVGGKVLPSRFLFWANNFGYPLANRLENPPVGGGKNQNCLVASTVCFSRPAQNSEGTQRTSPALLRGSPDQPLSRDDLGAGLRCRVVSRVFARVSDTWLNDLT